MSIHFGDRYHFWSGEKILILAVLMILGILIMLPFMLFLFSRIITG